MSNYYRFLIWMLLCCSMLQVKAQILPPEISCVRSDSVFWDVPNKNCSGPFNGYLLYASMTESGPYDLIVTIPEATQNAYFHPTTNNQTWFYYMETDADCPGQASIPSDTINNQIPDLVPIDFVTVQGNQVAINWTASTSPQTIGYTVYKITDTGMIPLENIFNQTTYIDSSALPSTQVEGYVLVAIDACFNESIPDVPHFSTYMVLGAQICEQTIHLEWNPYQNWSQGIAQQEIWMSTDLGTFELLSVVSDTTSQYVFDVLEDNVYHCFHIVAVEKDTGFRSMSNESCLTVDIVEPIQELDFTYINITPDNQVDLEWSWNTDAELMKAQLLRTSLGNDAVDTIDLAISNPLLPFNTYLDMAVRVEDTYYSYAIRTLDNCGDVVTTDFVNTLYLQGIALQNNSNELSWLPFDLPNALVNAYQLFEIDTLTGIETFLLEIAPTETKAIDILNPRKLSEANKCYVLRAIVSLTLADGTVQTITTRSNIICVKQFATLYMPNAFTPNGKNPIFRPKIVFGDAVSDYELVIFDRWGAKLFESTEIKKGWDGRSSNGRDIPKGTYTYSVRLVQPNGETIVKQGALVLLR